MSLSLLQNLKIFFKLHEWKIDFAFFVSDFIGFFLFHVHLLLPINHKTTNKLRKTFLFSLSSIRKNFFLRFLHFYVRRKKLNERKCRTLLSLLSSEHRNLCFSFCHISSSPPYATESFSSADNFYWIFSFLLRKSLNQKRKTPKVWLTQIFISFSNVHPNKLLTEFHLIEVYEIFWSISCEFA